MNESREVVIVLGKTGYGKSTWLQQYCRVFPRLFCFDPFAKFPAEYISADELLRRYDQGFLRDSPSFSLGTRLLDDLDLFGAVAFESKNCAFIIEECGVAFYKGERIPDWLSEIIFLGRHNSVSVILTAQRAASIPIELRSQANRFITFRQTEKNDVRWCADYIGELIDQLPNLPKFECIDADNDSVTRYGIGPIRASEPGLHSQSAGVGSDSPQGFPSNFS